MVGSGNLPEQPAQILKYIQPIRLCRFYEAVHIRAGTGAFSGLAEQPVLPTDHKRPDRVFCTVIMCRNITVFQETAKRFLLIPCISQCLLKILVNSPWIDLIAPQIEPVNDRFDLFLPFLLSFFRIQVFQFLLFQKNLLTEIDPVFALLGVSIFLSGDASMNFRRA